MLSDARFWTERTQYPFQPILFTQRPSGTNWLPNVLVKHPLPAKLSTTKYILTPPFYFTFSRGLLFSSGPGSAVNCDLQHYGQADSGAACGRKIRLRQPKSRHVQHVYHFQCHGHVNMLNLHCYAIVDTLPAVDEAPS